MGAKNKLFCEKMFREKLTHFLGPLFGRPFFCCRSDHNTKTLRERERERERELNFERYFFASMILIFHFDIHPSSKAPGDI